MRAGVTTSLTIEKFKGGVVTVPVSRTKNAVYGKRASGHVFATQRPGVNIFDDASDTTTDAKGRGIYYWDGDGALYFVNDTKIYYDDYGTASASTIDSGYDRVEFFEVGDKLVILDTENNKGYYTSGGGTPTFTEITDTDFPPKQTPALTLAKGGAELNGILYVLATNGEIWNSATEDPATWTGTDFITAEASADGGVALFKHGDHLAVFGNRSIEFFYDNANPTGSPLNARQDIVYDIGMVDHNTAFADANSVFFCGITSSGDIGVYLLSNFQISKISENDLDSLLTTAVTSDGLSLIGSGFSAGGRTFYLLTVYNSSGSLVSPLATYVYSGGWSVWDISLSGFDHFPLMGWTHGTATRAGQGILSNGDVISILDDFNPQDTIEASRWVEDGWVEAGWQTITAGGGTNIEMEIITGPVDLETRQPKFMSNLRVIAPPTSTSQTVTVQFSDNTTNSYNTGRTVDLSNIQNRLNRCGRFRTRNFKLSYSGSEKVEIEGIEGDVHV